MPKYTSIMKLKDINSNSNSSIFSTKNGIVMGILNLTTDSFFDGGKYLSEKQIIKRCRNMLEDGASIIDIGAQSTRPGSTQISAKDETKKLLPIIKLLKNNFPSIIISVDTFWAETAHETILAGADIINDISAGNMDKEMFNIIAKHNIPYIIMHMQNTPQDMQKNPRYSNVVNEVLFFFEEKIKKLKSLNISTKFNLPILVGTSRKSMIYNLLDTTAEKALNGTSVINTIALQNGANILRVHDVKEAKESIKITTFAKNNF